MTEEKPWNFLNNNCEIMNFFFITPINSMEKSNILKELKRKGIFVEHGLLIVYLKKTAKAIFISLILYFMEPELRR